MKIAWKEVLVLMTLLAGLCACTTVRVTKVGPGSTEPGIRYCLPQPILRVTPMADGKLDVRTEMLPDRSQEYAVQASSYFASHSLEMKVNNGLLELVDWDGKSDAVAADVATAAGEVAKARLDARAASERAEREAAQREADELESALAAATQARATAQARVDALEEYKDEDPFRQQYVAARIELDQAQATLDLLRRRRRGASGAAGAAGAANVAESTAGEGDAQAEKEEDQVDRGVALGPAVFRIVECPSSGVLQLVAMEFPGEGGGAQQLFPTYRVENSTTTTSPSKKLTVTPNKLGVSTKAGSQLAFELSFNLDADLVSGLLRKEDGAPVADGLLKVEKLSNRKVKATFDRSINNGKYDLILNVRVDGKATPPLEVPVTVTSS